MRNLILLALVFIASASAYAQSGYYGNPSYNRGYSPSYDTSYGSRNTNPYALQRRHYGLYQNQERPAAKPQEVSPEMILRAGIARLKGFMAGGGGQGGNSEQFIDNEVAPFFDFDYMAKWAAGPRWRYMSEAQRNQMGATIKRLFLVALAKNITGYGDPVIRIHRARTGRSRGEVSVSATVSPRYGRGVRVVLKFRFYKSPDGWKIFDVSANNTSAVLYYRRYFNRLASNPMLGQRR